MGYKAKMSVGCHWASEASLPGNLLYWDHQPAGGGAAPAYLSWWWFRSWCRPDPCSAGLLLLAQTGKNLNSSPKFFTRGFCFWLCTSAGKKTQIKPQSPIRKGLLPFSSGDRCLWFLTPDFYPPSREGEGPPRCRCRRRPVRRAAVPPPGCAFPPSFPKLSHREKGWATPPTLPLRANSSQ